MFFVGDSLVGQLCLLGTVALCTNRTLLSTNRTWQHLEQHVARTAGGTAIPAYQVSPAVCSNCSNVNAAIAARRFIRPRATPRSVLVVGMLGAHFKYDRDLHLYLQTLASELVVPFPGQTLKIGPVYQHFRTSMNTYRDGATCAAATPGGVARIASREADFVATMGPDSVSVSNLTRDAHKCHRKVAPGRQADCTHYVNSVYDAIKLRAARAHNAVLVAGGDL